MIGQTNKLVSKELRFFVRNLVPILGKINVNKHSLTTFLGFKRKKQLRYIQPRSIVKYRLKTNLYSCVFKVLISSAILFL